MKNLSSLKDLLLWRYSKDSIQEQVDKYSELGDTKSWRKISAWFSFFQALLAFVVFLFMDDRIDVNLKIMLILAMITEFTIGFLVLSGNRFFIVISMLLSTISIFLSFNGGKLIVLLLKLRFLIGALKVENLRAKLTKENNKEDADKFQHSLEDEVGKSKGFNIFKMVRNIFLFITVLALLSACFYWYEVRPRAIKKECSKFAMEKNRAKYDTYYLACTREKGL